MLSKDCRYYYRDYTPNHHVIEVGFEEFTQHMADKNVIAVNAYTNGILIVINENCTTPIYNIPVSGYGLFCRYTPDMVERLYAMNPDMADIINQSLGREAKDPEQARIYFMAKVLGARE